MSSRIAAGTDHDISDSLAEPRESSARPNNSGRAVVTLSPRAAGAARRLAARMGRQVNLPEVVRRGLILLDIYLDLSDEEELVIRNRATGEVERIRFTWETY